MTDAIRPLIAGNWKMNGLKASSAEFEAMLAGASAGRRQGRSAGLPAGDADCRLCRKGARLKDARGRGAGLPPQSVRRPYRRYFSRDAGRRRRQRHHRRPFRAPRRSRRKRRAGPAEGRSRLARRPRRHRLHRRDPAPARCRANARYLRRPAQGIAAGWGDRAIWWWPTSRSGRSAPVSRRPLQMSSRFIALSGTPSRRDLTARAPKSASSMAAR